MCEGTRTASAPRDHGKQQFAEEDFRLAFEASPTGMVITDGSGNIVLVNAEIEGMFGYGRQQLVGRHVRMLIPLDLREEYLQAREDYLRHPNQKRFGEGRHFRALRRDGTEFPVEVRLNPIHGGGTTWVLAMIVDTTERDRLDRLKDEFVINVNHELRTPLTSIVGSLGLLAGGAAGELPAAADRLVLVAQNNCRRLVRLINDVLDIEKMESGRMEFHFQRVELRAVTAQVIEANRAYADGFSVRLCLDRGAQDGEVLADPDRLTQVVTNLLSNAVKFSPQNGEVSITTTDRGDWMRVSVRDYGDGIPAAFKPHVFEKFAQADVTNARQKGGSGLGLSIVRQIVTRLGGQASFEDADGGGTVFHVDLPAWRQIADREVDSVRPAGALPILLCEDDPETAMSLREGLRPFAFTVDFAHDPAGAAERAKSNRYAALVIDLTLPNAGGLDFVRRVREQPELHRIPIVLLGARREGDPDKAINLNVLGWVEKPVDAGRLGRMLEAIRTRGANGRPRILHVDDDPSVLELVASALEPIAFVTSVQSLDEARRVLAEVDFDFDLAVIDVILGPESGLTLLPELRNRHGRPIPVVIFSVRPTGTGGNPQIAECLNKSRASLDDLVEAIRDRLMPRVHI